MIRKVTTSWMGLILVVLMGLATVSLSARQGATPMSADRSWAVQNQLKVIDENRAAFVDHFLSEWGNYLDMNVYDLKAELGSIAMKVPAWQLYGASLVGDFRTMIRVLTGVEGAGPYINALAEPQAKGARTLVSTSDVGPADLGSGTDQLVFVPIPPCRMVDTRQNGARTGILAAGASRSFDLTTTGLAKGQGSAVSCTDLPSFSYYAWAVNITVTGYSGSGWLVAWPFNGTEPTSSVANYGAAVYAIASGQTLTGCYGCGDDITVKAYGAATHVIIDVVGYYRDAGVASATMTRVAGNAVTITAGNVANTYGGNCPAGTSIVGGEYDETTLLYWGLVTESFTSTGLYWYFHIRNMNAVSSITIQPYSRCIDTPLKIAS